MTLTPFKNHPRENTCVDLFSGAGGLSLGFLLAGGTPLAGVDNDKDAIETYQAMFPFADNSYLGDIENWKPGNSFNKISVVIGGPPCQGFSLARGKRFVDDPRNHLYKEFIKAVSALQPSWIVMENVQGITNIGGGVILEQILEDFERIGYRLNYKVVNMAEYGVPQLRKRAIFVGNNKNIHFEWPEPLHSKKISDGDLFLDAKQRYVSVNEALGDLVLPTGNFFAHRANAQMRGPRNRCAHTEPAFTLRVRGDEFALCEVPAVSAFIPGDRPDEPTKLRKPENAIQEYLTQSCPDWIDARRHKIVRQSQIPLVGTRKLTVLEQARLQSFPDWFRFSGSVYSQGRQIGNAVPPLFGYHLFKRIFEYL